MRQSAKVALGIASFVPLLVLTLDFVLLGVYFFAFLCEAARGIEPGFPVVFLWAFLLQFVGFGILLLVTAVFVINVTGNARVKQELKLVWAVILFLGLMTLANVVILPVYWYLYIWRDSGDMGLSPNG